MSIETAQHLASSAEMYTGRDKGLQDGQTDGLLYRPAITSIIRVFQATRFILIDRLYEILKGDGV